MRTIVGVGFIGAGVMLIYGGMGGRLAPMMAALFVPSALVPKSDDGGSYGAGDVADDVIDIVVPWPLNQIPGVGG